MRGLLSRTQILRVLLLSSLAVAILATASLPAFSSPARADVSQLVSLSEHHLANGSSVLKLNQPIGTALDRLGNVYIADTGNNRVVKTDRAGRQLLVIGAAGPAAARLRLPSDVAVDGQGFIYVADTMNHRVAKFDARGRFLAAWGGLHGPSGLALGPDGFLYVA
ncbi:MAG TPA: NHL repeat-containing protein, partial [Thermoanaerobaculia bacterium]